MCTQTQQPTGDELLDSKLDTLGVNGETRLRIELLQLYKKVCFRSLLYLFAKPDMGKKTILKRKYRKGPVQGLKVNTGEVNGQKTAGL